MHGPLIAIFAALALLAVATLAALAQPVHEPGTICFTPHSWCWANPPGRPGDRCTCPTSGGTAEGILG